jgi:hypothetical protein
MRVVRHEKRAQNAEGPLSVLLAGLGLEGNPDGRASMRVPIEPLDRETRVRGF